MNSKTLTKVQFPLLHVTRNLEAVPDLARINVSGLGLALQELAGNYGPQAKSSPLIVFVNKGFFGAQRISFVHG